jgi:phosphate/sulfate permease
MQFQVPQFIEVEDKIFGPLTFRQFTYLAGAAGVVVIFYLLFRSFIIAILISAPIIGLALALAFYKVNNRPFIHALEAAFNYLRSRKLYLWRHDTSIQAPKNKKEVEARKPVLQVPTLSQNKLKEIAWSLDVQDHTKSREREEGSR